MQHLDLAKQDEGKIWIRKPMPSSDDGIMLKIENRRGGALALEGKTIRALHVAFDNFGDCFIMGDQHGQIYYFDLNKNRMKLCQRLGSAVTALSFSTRHKNEFLVCCADNSMKCFNMETKDLLGWMKGHSSAINNISVHSSGKYALTTSNDVAQLWDLDTFSRKRKLNIRENVGILKVFFLPLSNTIITCFKDDSIFGWEADTLQCKFQLPVPVEERSQYLTVTISSDSRFLVAGGRSQFLHVYTLDSRRLFRIIQLPNKVKSVKQLEFLPEKFGDGSHEMLSVLSKDGILRVIHIHNCNLLFDVGDAQNPILNFASSPNGKYIIGVMDSGSLHVFSVKSLTSHLNKAPVPLLKVVSEGATGSKKVLEDSRATYSSAPVSTARSSCSTLKTIPPPLSSARSAGTDVTSESSSAYPSYNVMTEPFELKKLRRILRAYGEYPAKYRLFIWKNLLQLPENHEAFSCLVDKGTHSAYLNLHEDYPMKSRKLLRVLQRTCSSLGHWSAIFGEVKFLPVMIFPLVKLFQNNALVCFEVSATVLLNWCQHWFEFFPNPPINILALVENLLAHHDKVLLNHFITYKVTSQRYAWPMLESLFSEVMTKEEWQVLFDNIFSNEPGYILHVVVAYLTVCRSPLLAMTEPEDFDYFFKHRNAANIRSVIKEANQLADCTPDNVNPIKLLDGFMPLSVSQYQAFNKYPDFVVDFEAKEREKLKDDEVEYLKEKQVASDLKKELSKKISDVEEWYKQQEQVLAAGEQRKQLWKEEAKIREQLARLESLKQ